VYFVREVVSGSVITLSLTRGGSLHDIQGAGTGTHTLHNKVNTPDLRGRAWVGLDNLGGSAASRITSSSTDGGNSTTLGGAGGAQTHTLSEAELATHSHTGVGTLKSTNSAGIAAATVQVTDSATSGGDTAFSAYIATVATGSSNAHNNTQPWMAGGYAIRF
jgi:microcystin-dependent protein